MKNDFSNLSVIDIIQRLANAKKTGSNCGGHTKAHFNNMAVEEYQAELASRGVPSPSNKDLYAQGEFNGIGSW